MTLKRLALVLSLSLLSLELGACATTKHRDDKPKQSQRGKRQKDEARKDWSKSNFSLSKNKDIEWKFIRRGRKAMGGPALDSY